MKNRYFVLIMNFLILVCLSVNALADDRALDGNPKANGHERKENSGSGFSGMVQLGGALFITKSQMHVDNKNERMSTLEDSVDQTDKIMPLLFFELNYIFESGDEIFFGIPFERDPRLTLGFKCLTPNGGKVSFEGFYSYPEEVWKDPYLVGVDREATDTTSYGAALGYELGNLELRYEYEIESVVDDDIGSRFNDLKRDGNIHRVGAQYGIILSRGYMLAPGFKYTLADMDGKSNRYNGYGGELNLMKMSKHYMIKLSIGAGVNEYDKTHPIFNKTRQDTFCEAMGVLSWLTPFGYERFSLNIGGGYEKTDANIDIHDSESYMTFLSIGYKFGNGGHHGDDD